ncbi:hypothetical protein KVT40_001072 [Elsinoe batatas]|uniref:Phosphatidylethanolamine-binding protein n=1 Tax=Elsinoe batatas TaxID=2601811 RepID=A0A8K0LAI3_9PEZI|nr:hypothetical protein KVT40_001072 [Elsinoe batatas]
MRPALWVTIATGLAVALPQQAELQQPLQDGIKASITTKRENQTRVIEAFTTASIIPTVIDPFTPFLNITAHWPTTTSQLGNLLSPSLLESEPILSAIDFDDFPNPKYWDRMVFILTDPDAKSHKNPIWAEFAHWIAYWPPDKDRYTTTTIPPSPVATPTEPVPVSMDYEPALTTPPSKAERTSLPSSVPPSHQPHDKKINVLPYKPPCPPPGTGPHRYVLLAFLPANSTGEKLNLTAPKGMKRGGHESPVAGAKLWAAEMGLRCVGGNFIYSSSDEGE